MNTDASLNRRGFLKIVAAAGLSLGLGIAVQRSIDGGEAAIVRSECLLMGTPTHIALAAQDRKLAQAAIEAVFAEMERLVHLFDHRRVDSPLASLNRQGQLDPAPVELVDLVCRANQYSVLSGGAFDLSVKPIVDARSSGRPVIPDLHRLVDYRQIQVSTDAIYLGHPGMALTLDGIAKGRVIDGGLAVLAAYGFERALVEAGGDLASGGAPVKGMGWKIGVQNPRASNGQGTITVVQVSAAGMATSGDYMNSFSLDFSQNHLIDPVTGASPRELSSATVIAPNATDADALSTALMVMGIQDGLELIEKLENVEAFLIGKDLQTYRSAGFPAGPNDTGNE